ncbi:hypothetical protein [Nodosilinea sp. FACHB-13]|uniref:hypothetical protein n=1 Tax=Cyanophyceae TaxID=3028117 RepID=UPI001684D671|nr:hypothetical protein [Nodosilinea sp. FACHB-13]MBD2110040.1 hypothetical protein [Nodosilinea sp. FACHB-13]
MINPLIDLIKIQLQNDLVKVVPKAQWHGMPLEQVENLKVPCVAIYGGDITFLPIHQNRSRDQDCREFQQELWIDLMGKSNAQVEQLTSLIMGLISLNQQIWLADCNQLLSDSAHHYSSSTISTRHRFRQIQIVSASPKHDGDKVRSRLRFCAIGQLEMTQLAPDQATLIKTIIATGTIGQVQNSQTKSDQITGWKTDIDSNGNEESSNDEN